MLYRFNAHTRYSRARAYWFLHTPNASPSLVVVYDVAASYRAKDSADAQLFTQSDLRLH